MGRSASLFVVWLATTPALAAQAGTTLWRPEERVVISDMSRVDALAASEDLLYAATSGGLGVYDLRFRRWELPVTRLDGYPPERVTVALADPADRSVWLGTERAVVHYVPELQRFDRVSAPGPVHALMFDRDDPFGALYVGGRFGWRRLPRGALGLFQAMGLPPAGRRRRSIGVEEALARMPFVEARGPLALTDERMRRYRYTAAALVPVSDDAFFGTDGRGVVRVDGATTEMEWLPFGLLDGSVGAVIAVPEGVWVGTGIGALRVGLTFVAQSVDRYLYEEGPGVTGFRFRDVRDLTGRHREIWLATDQGVVRVEPGGRAETAFTGFGAGMGETFALAQGSAGVWVGTRRGLAFVSDEGEAHRVDDRVQDPIYALVASRDTVWVGGERGLGLSWMGSREIVRTDDMVATFALQDPIVALTLIADTLVAVTPERIAWRAPGSEWVVERVLRGDLGQLTAVAPEAGGVWIGGVLGVAFYRFTGRQLLVFNRPGDVPGPVRDLAVDRRYLWVATEQGLVRFLKETLVP
ncbi:MAG: hypothetical protein PVF27_03880 [Gemmatimonadales bacterium]|jgi:hypothetical protein